MTELNSAVTVKRGVSGNAMKIIAIIAMTCDHITMMFMPTDYIWQIVIYQFLRAFGRFTAVIMCYMAAEGFHYTKSLSKYMSRLLIFSLISHLAYSFIHSGNLLFTQVFTNGNVKFQTSVIWPILLGIMILYIIKADNIKLPLKITLVLIFLISSALSDWNIIAIAYILAAEILRNNTKLKFIALAVISVFAAAIPIIYSVISDGGVWYQSLYMLGVFPALAFLKLYNGKRGKRFFGSKWLFYIYYPAHMLIIGLVYMFTVGF